MPTRITIVAVLVAAAAAVAWLLTRGEVIRPSPPAAAPPAPADASPTPRAAPAITGAGSPAPAPATPAPAADPLPAREDAAAAELSRKMQKLVSDLEFTPGRREPAQQLKEPQPAPWRPPAAAAPGPAPVIERISPSTAAPGTRVRIHGRHLRAAQVMFGALPAEVEGDSETELVVLVPEGGEGAVPVAVTNLDGGYAIAEAAFTFPPPAPARPQ
jgi:hypothetical protein